MCGVSNRADAVAASLDAQRGMAAEDFSAVDQLKVRMAIHVGNADERDGDYFGPAVNRVARLLAVGYGGQVLVWARPPIWCRTNCPRKPRCAIWARIG